MRLKKELGQHLLHNPVILQKIALMAQNAKIVMEIGPGTGNLTEYLLKNTYLEKLILIEKDIEMLEIIKKKFNDPRLVLFNLDATSINLANFEFEKITIIGNFPYNVGNSIIVNLIEQSNYITKIVAMLQKEVVQRLCAKLKTKDYGKLTVLCALFGKTKKLIDINPANFIPPPKVDSSILEFIPHNYLIATETYKKIIKICNIGFGNRRKKLVPLLKSYFSNDNFIKLDSILPNKDVRIEELDIEQIVKIAEII